jgi:hypothetical protein
VAPVHAHARSMIPKWAFLYAILGSSPSNRFVSPLWVRHKNTQERGSMFLYTRSLITTRAFPPLLPPFPFSQQPLSPLSRRNKKLQSRSYSLEPNPTVIKMKPTERKAALRARCTARARWPDDYLWYFGRSQDRSLFLQDRSLF